MSVAENQSVGLIPAQGVQTLGGVPEGMTALVLRQLSAEAELLNICLDEAEVERLQACLGYFAPEAEVIYIPPWDCLPYDRVSPTPDVVGQRLAALSQLMQPATRPRICLTSINALLMRVMPRAALQAAARHLIAGREHDPESLLAYLIRSGYQRVDTVREAGEFARRGSLFDLYPPGQQPYRLDFFGDTLESIKPFDAASQRTFAAQDRLSLLPVSEFILEEDSVSAFRTAYREAFGAVLNDDPLYEAVSDARRHAGMEHWLPFFYRQPLETVLDYLPNAALVLAPQTQEAVDARLAQIADFYLARQELQALDKKAQAPIYKPIKPDLLFLGQGDWESVLSGRRGVQLSPFTLPGQPDLLGRLGRNFADIRSQTEINLLDALLRHVAELGARKKVLLAGYTNGSRDRLLTMLKEHGEVSVESVVLPMERGFETPVLAVITETDIFGERLSRPAKKRRKADNFLTEASSLNAGDYVVHIDHGVGRYEGLETVMVGSAPHDCLRLIYAEGDKLFVPVENIEVLTRYADADAKVTLDKLGGVAWQGRKARVKKKLLDMAAALLRLAAERQLKSSDIITAPDGLYAEFCARFPYAETEDQQRAIDQVLEDLGAGRPMDRLVCGDVGFGKTEVAMRAAFVVAAAGYQVAIVTPTTLLARQHAKNFSERFRGLPLRLAQLSRLVNTRDAALTKQELADGKLDIVIGTHALLSKNIKFNKLGLVIVDEEQHFGVKQKERLKELRAEVHVLTLTATPIPRTLQLALSGVREMSLITTPPIDRLAVRSYVLPFDPLIIKDALMREHFRGGQSFYVCPRIEDQPKIAERLRELVPDLKFVIANGQMPAEELEQVMTDFYGGKYDILLATNIIESGLDIPSANTMIIHRADLFGLAQLYQLRGRVGRGKLRGYAYLTYLPNTLLNPTAKRRLEVMSTLDSLGAGFTLASHDMDIRGGGNLLGEEQSGHIKEVGVELYQHMLEEAIAEVKSGHKQETASDWQPQINLGLPVLIPETYVPELAVRLGLYRRLAELHEPGDLDAFAAELGDRFGPVPEEVQNLLAVMGIKQLCRAAHVERCDAGPKGAIISFHANSHPSPTNLISYLTKQGNAMKMRPDHKLVVLRAWDNPATRLKGVQRLLTELGTLL